MPTRHDITITFAYLQWQEVRWQGRSGVYTIVWRRWHQGEVGEHILYGLRLAEEASCPTANVWTVQEKDLKLA